MKTLRFVFFLLYRYYSKGGTKVIPYFSTLCAVSLLFFVHVFQLLLIFNVFEYFPISGSENRIIRYGKIALISVPVFIFFALLIKEKDIKNAYYEEEKIKKGNLFLLGYAILSVCLLLWLITKVRPS